MEEATAAKYWCYECSRLVNPILEADTKCSRCEGRFVEECQFTNRDSQDSDDDFGSDHVSSYWQLNLHMTMGNSRGRCEFRRLGFEDEDTVEGESRHGSDTELDREIESIIRRGRRNMDSILRLLRDARAGIASESENADSARDRDGDKDRHDTDGLFSSNSGSYYGGGDSTLSPLGSSSNGCEGASF